MTHEMSYETNLEPQRLEIGQIAVNYHNILLGKCSDCQVIIIYLGDFFKCESLIRNYEE